MGHLFNPQYMIQTFIYTTEDYDGEQVTISGREAHHIADVLRLGPGEMVRLIDGLGTAHICEITSIASKKIICSVIKTIKSGGEPTLKLSLAIGLSPEAKFDTIIEKGTEVGISRFIPILTEKGRVKIAEMSGLARKMERWRRVCEAAVKQSSRSVIPHIDPPLSFRDFLLSCRPAGTMLFHPGDRTESFYAADMTAIDEELTLVVGPESGFSGDEIESARNRGIRVMSLGDRVLRTETAAVVIPALVIYLTEVAKA
jgi:16S rRNA (uracil1498-N3)-methyltransferase